LTEVETLLRCERRRLGQQFAQKVLGDGGFQLLPVFDYLWVGGWPITA
jgi:hypothetical protein